MRRILFPAVVMVAVVAAPMAYAATATGTVRLIDRETHTLTLENGSIYQLPAGFSNAEITPGKRVQITWEMQDGKHMASAVVLEN